MPEIKLEKRFPNVSTEDFCDIFNKGLLTGLKAAGKNAIPIEWIKRYIKEEGIYPNRELLSVEQADAIERMIENWEKENEHK